AAMSSIRKRQVATSRASPPSPEARTPRTRPSRPRSGWASTRRTPFAVIPGWMRHSPSAASRSTGSPSRAASVVAYERAASAGGGSAPLVRDERDHPGIAGDQPARALADERQHLLEAVTREGGGRELGENGLEFCDLPCPLRLVVQLALSRPQPPQRAEDEGNEQTRACRAHGRDAGRERGAVGHGRPGGS